MRNEVGNKHTYERRPPHVYCNLPPESWISKDRGVRGLDWWDKFYSDPGVSRIDNWNTSFSSQIFVFVQGRCVVDVLNCVEGTLMVGKA